MGKLELELSTFNLVGLLGSKCSKWVLRTKPLVEGIIRHIISLLDSFADSGQMRDVFVKVRIMACKVFCKNLCLIAPNLIFRPQIPRWKDILTSDKFSGIISEFWLNSCLVCRNWGFRSYGFLSFLGQVDPKQAIRPQTPRLGS